MKVSSNSNSPSSNKDDILIKLKLLHLILRPTTIFLLLQHICNAMHIFCVKIPMLKLSANKQENLVCHVCLFVILGQRKIFPHPRKKKWSYLWKSVACLCFGKSVPHIIKWPAFTLVWWKFCKPSNFFPICD